MRIDILTLFPDMIRPIVGQSILHRAQVDGHVDIHVHDYREYSTDKHRSVDDYPYGGGAGMVLRVEPVVRALRDLDDERQALRILMTPQGIPYSQERARTLAKNERIIILCGHYEGYDERIRDYFDVEISIGDYILTGGEIAAMVVVDSLVRLIPGVLNNEDSAKEDSFSAGLLEYPQYTRPRVFEGRAVPEVLLSGDHGKIEAWRKEQALMRTKKRRPDLYEDYLKRKDNKSR